MDIKASDLRAREKDRLGRRATSGPLRGTVTDIFVEYQCSYSTAVEGGDLNFIFWGDDSHSTYLMGEESMTAGGADIVKYSDGALTNLAHLGGVNLPYTDLDNSAEWHLSVVNYDASTTLTAAVATLSFNFQPEYPA